MIFHRVVRVLPTMGAIGLPLLVCAQGVAFEVASIREARAPMEYVQASQLHVGVNVNGSRAEYGFMSLGDSIPYARPGSAVSKSPCRDDRGRPAGESTGVELTRVGK